ncbi:MAG: ATP-binding protein, partial [Pseudomonadota bacterium]
MNSRASDVAVTSDALDHLIEENRLLRAFFAHMPVPCAVFDEDLNLVVWNDGYEITHPDLARAIDDARRSDGKASYATLMRSVLKGQVPDAVLEQAIETRVEELRSSDGSPVDRFYPRIGWLRITRFPLPSGAIGAVAFDITELKARESELREARAIAAESERLRSEFLANMSHEIRTPLNGVLGMAELLRHGGLDERQQMFADTIVRSGKDLLHLINDVLDVAKIEAGEMELDTAPFDPLEAIEDITTLLSSRAADKGIKLAVQVVGQMPGSVIGDGARLRQILTNLIGNAIKFTEEGHVLVRAKPELKHRDGASPTLVLSIEVEDTGCGVPKDRQELIFQKFKQVGGDKRGEGTGLGLAITKALVVLMGGQIGVRSDSVQGSTFWIELDMPVAANTHTVDGADRAAGARVLIVDDNPLSQKILLEQVFAWNCSPIVANSGPEALDIVSQSWAKNNPFDVAIIDNDLMHMSGEEVLRQIRLLPGYSRLPAILLTQIDAPDATERLAHLGLEACLVKPPRASQIYDAIADIMAR